MLVFGIMTCGAIQISESHAQFSGVIPAVGQKTAMFSGVLHPAGIKESNQLFTGQILIFNKFDSGSIKKATMEINSSSSVSVVPLDRTTPMVVAKPLDRTKPPVTTTSKIETQPTDVVIPQNNTIPTNTTAPLNNTIGSA
jgi:hypothetical protein